jgi:hypothetical protein
MIDSSAAWVTATISVALMTLLFMIIQLTKTPARWSHPRLAKVRTVTRRELGSSTEPLSPGSPASVVTPLLAAVTARRRKGGLDDLISVGAFIRVLLANTPVMLGARVSSCWPCRTTTANWAIATASTWVAAVWQVQRVARPRQAVRRAHEGAPPLRVPSWPRER